MEQADDDPNTVYVDVVAINPRPAWCDGCLTSSALTFDIAVLDDDGFGTIDEVTECPDCGTDLFADDEPA